MSQPITVDAAALAMQAFKYLGVAQDITDATTSGLAEVDAHRGALGAGPASQMFLQSYGPAAASAETNMRQAGPALHDLAQAVYDWSNAYIEANTVTGAQAQGLQA